MINNGIKALRASAQEIELSEKNVSVGVLGIDSEWRKLSEDELKTLLATDDNADVDMVEA